jgi:small conductance mechanosensitive channel
MNIFDSVLAFVAKNGVNFLYALAIFFIGKWAARLIANLVAKLMTKSKVDKTLISFTSNLLYFLILIFVCIAALNRLGIQTASLIAIVGAAGLAIGMALQGSLANFASGVLIIIFRPYNIGDTITAAGSEGVVDDIQIFNTILKLPDGKFAIIPNGKITGDKIIVLKSK